MVVLAPEGKGVQEEGAGALALRTEQVARWVDPGLAGGLRAWLEDAASVVVRARGEDAPALHLGARELFGVDTEGRGVAGDAVTGSLVHALLRQLVTTGVIDDPLDDAVRALRVEPRRIDIVRAVDGMTESARVALRAEVTRHVVQLRGLLPKLGAEELPCTDDRVTVPLAGGRVVLHATMDVRAGVWGTRGTDVALAIGLSVQGSWTAAWRRMRLLAVLETIRSGTPPRRLAVLHTGAGRYDATDVLDTELSATTARVATRLTEMGAECS